MDRWRTRGSRWGQRTRWSGGLTSMSVLRRRTEGGERRRGAASREDSCGVWRGLRPPRRSFRPVPEEAPPRASRRVDASPRGLSDLERAHFPTRPLFTEQRRSIVPIEGVEELLQLLLPAGQRLVGLVRVVEEGRPCGGRSETSQWTITNSSSSG